MLSESEAARKKLEEKLECLSGTDKHSETMVNQCRVEVEDESERVKKLAADNEAFVESDSKLRARLKKLIADRDRLQAEIDVWIEGLDLAEASATASAAKQNVTARQLVLLHSCIVMLCIFCCLVGYCMIME